MAAGIRVDPDIQSDYANWTEEDFKKVLQGLSEDIAEIEELKIKNLKYLEKKEKQSPNEFAQEILDKITTSYINTEQPSAEELNKLIEIIIQNKDIKEYVFNYLDNQLQEIDSEEAEKWKAYLQGRLDELNEKK